MCIIEMIAYLKPIKMGSQLKFNLFLGRVHVISDSGPERRRSRKHNPQRGPPPSPLRKDFLNRDKIRPNLIQTGTSFINKGYFQGGSPFPGSQTCYVFSRIYQNRTTRGKGILIAVVHFYRLPNFVNHITNSVT